MQLFGGAAASAAGTAATSVGRGMLAAQFGTIFATTALMGAMAAKHARSALRNSDYGSEVFLSGDPNDVRQVIYGRAWVGGTLRYRNTDGLSNRALSMVIVLAGHSCDAVEQVLADRETLTLDGSGNVTSPSKWAGLINVRFVMGSDSQAADSTLDARFANWTSNHRLRGCAYAIVTVIYDENNLNSMPQFRFLVRGRRVYDPRLDSTNGGSGSHRLATESTWEWSENAVLCHCDYWRGIMINGIRIAGPGVSSSRFSWPNVIAEANVCDESVSLAAGGNEKRYTANGVIDPRNAHGAVLELFEQTIAGDIPVSDGKWRYFCGAYRAPTLALGPDHFIGPLRINVHQPEGDRRDTAHGRFSSQADLGTAVDFSPVSLSTAVVGSERVTSVDMQLVNDVTNTGGVFDGGARAQRIAKLLLERDAAGKLLSCTTNLYGLRAMPGESIAVTHAAFGLSSQTMRVLDVRLRAVQQEDRVGLVVDLTLQAGPSSLYSWSAEEAAISAAPTLIQADVPVPTLGAQWYPVLTGVSQSGGTFTKTGAANSWDSSVYSREGFEACEVSFRVPQLTADVFVGLNTDPATDHSYVSVDYGLHAASGGGGTLYCYESGVNPLGSAPIGTYATTDQLRVRYDGAFVYYFKNSTLLRKVARPLALGTRYFLDSSFYTSGGSIDSLVFQSIGLAAPITGNLIRTDAWRDIAFGSLTSAVGNFYPNQSADDENRISILTGPFGVTQLVWQGRCTDPGVGSGGGANGGWSNTGDLQGLNPEKTYRSSVWVRRRDDAGGSNGLYFGCGQASNTYDVGGGGVNTNPYFISGVTVGAALPVRDRWYLMVGFIHGTAYAGTHTGLGGIYDPVAGQLTMVANDFRMAPTASTQEHRVYMYYGGNTAVRVDWCDPRFEEVNGNEPNINALLRRGQGLEWQRDLIHDEMAYVGATDLHNHWLKVGGGIPDGDISLISDTTAPGGQAVRFGNNSGDDMWWGVFNDYLLPYDGISLYEVGVVVRRVAGSGTFYCGLEGVASDQTTRINTVGADASSSQHYLAAGAANPSSSFQTFRGYAKGWSGSPTGGSQSNDSRTPGSLYTGIVFVRPLLIVNYNGAAGQMDVAAVWVKRIPGALAPLDNVPLGALDLAARGWTLTSTFSATDADTVAWGAGTFTASDGTNYSIGAGNTGNISALTYIYLDVGVSTTALQTTTTAINAIGAGRVLVAVAQNSSNGSAFYQVFGGAGGVGGINLANVTGTLTTAFAAAGLINANVTINADGTLSGAGSGQASLTSLPGAISAGQINSNAVTTAKLDANAVTAAKIAANTITASQIAADTITANEIAATVTWTKDLTISTSGKVRQGKSSASDTAAGFWLGYDGSSSYDFHIGDSSSYLWWDGSAATLKFRGNLDFATQTFAPSWTGFSSAPSGNLSYLNFGSYAVVWNDTGGDIIGTSNSASMTITNLPSAIRPGALILVPCILINNDAYYYGQVSIDAAGTLTFNIADDSSGGVLSGNASFATSGGKGAPPGFILVYPL